MQTFDEWLEANNCLAEADDPKEQLYDLLYGAINGVMPQIKQLLTQMQPQEQQQMKNQLQSLFFLDQPQQQPIPYSQRTKGGAIHGSFMQGTPLKPKPEPYDPYKAGHLKHPDDDDDDYYQTTWGDIVHGSQVYRGR